MIKQVPLKFYKSYTNGVASYNVLPAFNVGPGSTEVTNLSEIQTEIGRFKGRTDSWSQNYLRTLQEGLTKVQSGESPYVIDPGTGVITTSESLSKQEANKAAVAAGTMKNIGTESAPLYVPTGSPGALLHQDPKAYASKYGTAGVPGFQQVETTGQRKEVGSFPQSSDELDQWKAMGRSIVNGVWVEPATTGAITPTGGIPPSPALDFGGGEDDDITIGTSTEARRDQAEKDVKEDLGITGDVLPAIPGLPTYQTAFETLREEHGVEAIETQLTNLDKTIADLQASLTSGLYDEEGKLKPMELIGTAQRELQRQAQETIDTLTRQKNVLINQYNAKANLINSIMSFMQMDYNAAKDAYDTSFNQQIKIQTLIEGRLDRADEEANQIQDDARANLGVIASMMSAQGKIWSDLDASMQSQITKWELEGELPLGITKMIYDVARASGKIMKYHTYSKDKTQVHIMYEDGTMEVRTTGLTAEGDDDSPAEILKNKVNEAEQFIISGTNPDGSPIRGKDGKISPRDYIDAKKFLFDEYGYSKIDFDKRFVKYANLDHDEEYELNIDINDAYKYQ